MAIRTTSCFISWIIAAFIFASCGQPPPAPLVPPSPSSTATSAPTSTPRDSAPTLPPAASPISTITAPPVLATPTPDQDIEPRTKYIISATLNYSQHQLSVEQLISYTNHYPESLPDLLLIVEPSRYPATFNLRELTWQDGQPVEEFDREIGLIRIPLDTPLDPGDSTGLSITYDLNLPSPSPSYYGRPVPFGYSSRQTNLVDWYPFIPPYSLEEGWIAHQAWVFGEHLVYETADFQVNIQISDPNPDLVIAASAPGALVDAWWQYTLNDARNFSWSVSDQYVLSTTTADSVLVLSYYFPNDIESGESVLKTTAEAIRVYNELFGEYPRQTLSVVEADFLDGMEYDGLYFLSKGFYNLYSGEPGDYLTAIAAHETAHQWWYGAVGNDQALEPWLDEALSTYSEKIYYEKMNPLGLDWWGTYRIDYYEPRGWVDGSIYNPDGYRAYRDAIYLNGAKFLDDLRETIGEEAFFGFLGDYARQNAHQISTADDFFSLLAQYTQEDLQMLFSSYFEKR